MHFYYFLYIFRHISQISRAFSCLPCRMSVHVVTPSGVEPSHASRGEWCAAAILTDRQQLKNKNTQMMLAAHPGFEPGTTPFVVGVLLLAILTDHQQPKKQKYLDYDILFVKNFNL